MVKKFMVSLPMNDKTTEKIKEERAAAIAYGEKLGYEFIETLIDPPKKPTHNDALYYFSKSCGVMVDCDLVIFTGGWNSARGCQMEYEIARKYGIETTVYYGERGNA